MIRVPQLLLRKDDGAAGDPVTEASWNARRGPDAQWLSSLFDDETETPDAPRGMKWSLLLGLVFALLVSGGFWAGLGWFVAYLRR